ncbi:hypothetical protein TD95_003875 [Thielaviopsis punctulata]|uniref:Sorting nexin MVP1 n=1 Tax=Thielaviopsis punctulata TaxID=72032 RepID=A0A0F4ZJA1_9PEZI|nr:hypothetical protein TD95_003875 [Thielaviopsis punctulata]
MSLFGSSPPSPGVPPPGAAKRRSLFDADSDSGPDPGLAHSSRQASALFADPAPSSHAVFTTTSPSSSSSRSASPSPWSASSRRRTRPKSRAEIIRSMLPSATADSAVPDAYDSLWADALRDEARRRGELHVSMLGEQAVDEALDAAMVKDGAARATIREIVVPEAGDAFVGRGEYNVLLALIGLVQAGAEPTLEAHEHDNQAQLESEPAVDPGAAASRPAVNAIQDSARDSPPVSHPSPNQSHNQSAYPIHSSALAPEMPDSDYIPSSPSHSHSSPPISSPIPQMEYPDAEDPWGSPDVHKDHGHSQSHSNSLSQSHAAAAAVHHEQPDEAAPSINSAVLVSNTPGSPISGSDTMSSSMHRSPASPEAEPVVLESAAAMTAAMGHGASTFAGPATTTLHTTTTTPAASTHVPVSTAALDFSATSLSARSHTTATATAATTRPPPLASPTAAWSYYDNGGFSDMPVNPFGGPSPAMRNSVGRGTDVAGASAASRPTTRTGPEETVLVTLLPEKEGIFLFQHHNYEVASPRRNSKVIRRYSDFVWLLGCLHKRYPFRVLPMLPPKRVALNGNHLSNDGAFIEKRRRGLARFLNAIVRHPVLSQEQLVIMFLTVPTELSVWRKQATISVQDEFVGRELTAGLEESLPIGPLEELFARTRNGVKRSAELYIGVCNIMDRLVKRTEGVAADHARIALSLISLTETHSDTYASDTNEVPLLNDGLQAMSRHLRTCQSLLEDESRAWEAGVLEDLKQQRDGLVSLRDMFERRDQLDKDNIPALEKRIRTNEDKIAVLRQKPEGMVKPGEVEKLAEAIISDKQSIVAQHNRSVFVRECVRDELRYFQASQYHVTRWNQDWAQERVKYAEMMADNWRSLIDGLEGMPTGE